MRIISEDSNEHVTKLTLQLKSAETALSLYTEPLAVDRDREGYLSRPNSATIVFKDSREIDSLIDALQKFRDRNVRYIGVWR